MAPEPTPSKTEIAFSLGALREHAKLWDKAADDLELVAKKTENLELNRIEAGLFQLLVDTVNNARTKIHTLGMDAGREMRKGGDGIRKVASTYEDEEAKNVHELTGLY